VLVPVLVGVTMGGQGGPAKVQRPKVQVKNHLDDIRIHQFRAKPTPHRNWGRHIGVYILL